MIPTNITYFNNNWKPLTAKLPEVEDETPKELGYSGRTYQTKCYKQFKDKRLTLLISPTGSGKSLMQVFNAAREVIDTDYKQKQIFVVPQLNIGTGFSQSKHKKLKIAGKVYHWEISTDCCGDNQETVGRIKKFLLSNNNYKSYRANKIIGGCTAVASSAAFVAAFKSMTPEEKLIAIKNTSFRLDEVHHIAGGTNELGKFCKFLLDNKGSLHLCTATFFRGDRQIIIEDKYFKEFDVCRITFMEHWNNLGLKALHQNYVSYKTVYDLRKQILDSIKSEPDQCPIIIVPQDGCKFFKKADKWKWVKELVKGLVAIYGKDNVLDLVSPDTQEQHKEKLLSGKQDFSCIVTCNIGKEGADWVKCSRIYNTYLDANVLQPIQKLGRALRSHKDKTEVKMINYIEYFDKWDASVDVIRQKLSDRFNAVVVASMMDEMFFPILMPTIEPKKQGVARFVTLDDAYGSKRNDVINELVRQLSGVHKNDMPHQIDQTIDIVIEQFSDDLKENISNDVLHERLKKEILRRLNPNDPKLKIDGMIINFVREHGWDKVVKENIAPHNFLGTASTNDLKKLYGFMNNDFMEMFNKVKKIGLKNLKKGTDEYRWAIAKRRLVLANKD